MSTLYMLLFCFQEFQDKIEILEKEIEDLKGIYLIFL